MRMTIIIIRMTVFIPWTLKLLPSLPHQLSSDSGIYLYIVVGDNMATTLKVAGCSSAMTWAMTRM